MPEQHPGLSRNTSSCQIFEWLSDSLEVQYFPHSRFFNSSTVILSQANNIDLHCINIQEWDWCCIRRNLSGVLCMTIRYWNFRYGKCWIQSVSKQCLGKSGRQNAWLTVHAFNFIYRSYVANWLVSCPTAMSLGYPLTTDINVIIKAIIDCINVISDFLSNNHQIKNKHVLPS